jgi:hypothetical protein
MIRRVLQPLLFTMLAAGLSAGQVTTTKSVAILRTTIETYPEAERRPILDYLDGARIVADRVIGKFANERDIELNGEFSRLAKARGQKIEVLDYASRVRRTYGSVTLYQFKCQVLEAPAEKPGVSDEQRARSVAYYSISTTKVPSGDLILTVRTIRIGNLHAASFFSVENYSGKTQPCLEGQSADSEKK